MTRIIRPKAKKLAFPPKKTDTTTFDFTEEELIHGLNDPRWRLNNLYHILDKKQQVVIFRENDAQRYLFDNLHTRSIIVKCRKLGFSTAVQLFSLDSVLFCKNTFAKVIAQDLDLSKAIFGSVFKFSYDRLPTPLKEACAIEGLTSQNGMSFVNGSSIECSTNSRGQTPNILHVSEMGPIARANPIKSKEIMAGAITSVAEDGLVFVESTASGAEGDFYEMVQTAQRLQEEGKALWKLQFKLFFYGWHQNPEYVAPIGAVAIPKKDQEYFDNLENELKIKISPEQRTWYVMFRDNTYNGDEETMWAEQPSSCAEAFKVSTEGCYFKDQFIRVRKEGRINRVAYDPHYPVSLFFDIGSNDETCIWFIQGCRSHFAVIDYMEASGEPFAYFVRKIDELGYVLGYVYLPHDAAQRRQGGDRNMTAEEMLAETAPHWRFWLIPRTPDKQMAIMQAREVFPLVIFDEANCSQGIKHLQNYKKEWNPRAGTWRNTPKHDKASNAADAFLQFAQAKASGAFTITGGSNGGTFGNNYGSAFTEAVDMSF